MTETTVQFIKLAQVSLASVCAGLYGFGGVSGKWKRRYLAPVVLLFNIVVFGLVQGTFNLWMLLSVPLYIGASTLGYGAEQETVKWMKRSLYATAFLLASMPIFVVSGRWGMFLTHAVLISTTIPLGVKNYSGNARIEETYMGMTFYLIPMISI